MGQLTLGLILAILVSALAYWARALTISGAVASVILGTVVFGLGGLSWAILLLVFFVSSSLLSRLAGGDKMQLEQKNAKGARRDAGQVMATGGVAGLCVLGFFWTNQPGLFLIYAASLAAANADTWSTELGVLSRKPPILITTRKTVEVGTSGGITLTGTVSGFGGATLMGFIAALLVALGSPSIAAKPIFINPANAGFGFLWLTVTLSGWAGSWFDSFLGATVQVVYFCARCGKETERYPFHTCGTVTTYTRGWQWLNNDWVNAACTLFSALVMSAVLTIYILA